MSTPEPAYNCFWKTSRSVANPTILIKCRTNFGELALDSRTWHNLFRSRDDRLFGVQFTLEHIRFQKFSLRLKTHIVNLEL